MQPPNNLPLQLTSFIGREREIAEVKRLLGTSRLLTLTGAGGSGKTRLALQVASDVLDEYPDGVYFVNLAPITDPDLVVSSIAQALDVKEAAGQPLLETLKAYLRGKEMLLLLDNFEQVVQAAPLVVELLLAEYYLKVMVTSRESLHLQGEQLYPVLPLELPDITQQASIEVLSQNEAVALFRERATSVKPDFDLTEENAPVVAHICARLDGLPLAIELAAARIGVLTPQAMLSRLESRLNLLTGGAYDRPARHQTLRNTIDWSYDLLSDGEKHLFRRMAVFQGGRTLEALEAVCNFDGALQISVLEGAQSLLDKSLLHQRASSSGESRFVMLETIHEYAGEKLGESGEEAALQREHALYFMLLAEEAEPHLRGAKQQEWMDILEEEHDNIRTTLAWCKHDPIKDAVMIGLRLVGGLWRFWFVRGYLSEGRSHCKNILHLAAESENSAAIRQNRAFTQALYASGALAYWQGDHTTAEQSHNQCLSMWMQMGDKAGMAAALNGLGVLAYNRGQYELAHELYNESLALWRQTGNKWGTANALHNLAGVLQINSDYSASHALYEESLAIRRELGDKSGIAHSLGNLGRVAFLQRDYDSARRLFEESLAIRQELHDKWGIAFSKHSLGQVAWQVGNITDAIKQFNESLLLARELGSKGMVALSLAALGGVAAACGDPRRAARLLGASESIFQALNIVLDSTNSRDLKSSKALVQTQLGKNDWDRLLEAGRAMTLEEAVSYALESIAPPRSKSNVRSLILSAKDLSRREIEVLRLLAHGLTNDQIAERLYLSTNTVRAHLYSIYSKIDVSNRGAAIRFATDHGLI